MSKDKCSKKSGILWTLDFQLWTYLKLFFPDLVA